MPIVGAGMLAIALRHEAFHDVTPDAERAQGKAASNRLAQGTQVWRRLKVFLRSAGAHTESAQDFVEDEKHAAFAGQAPERRDELRRRNDAAGVVVDGLAQDGCQLVRMLRKCRL